MAIKTSLNDMQIGDKISCEYYATLGSVGSFTNLGAATKSLIPNSSSSAPNGSFYFIHTGFDHLGRMKLVADRCIQSSINWNTLNTFGIATGCGRPIEFYNTSIGSTNLIPTMTSNNTPSPVVISASGSIDTFYYAPYKAFDGDDATFWYSNTSSPAWIKIDFGTTKKIGKINVLCPAGYGLNSSTKLQASNDNSTWIDVFTFSDTDNSPSLIEKSLPITSTGYRYWRVYQGTVNQSFRVYKIEMFEGISEKTFTMYNFNLRLLTGGVSSSDTDNEWDKIIVNSNLGGTITAGDNSVWNWNGTYTYTSTSATTGSTYRVARGGSLTTWTTGSTGGDGYFRPVLIVEDRNTAPSLEISIDKESTFSDDIVLSGLINDPENDPLTYRIKINEIVVYDWLVPSQSPVIINVSIPTQNFNIGSNTILVECKDSYNAISKKSVNVIRKEIDSFYISDTNCFNYSINLKAGGIYVSYIKIENPDELIGYIKNSLLSFELLNGNDTSGVIKVAPIVADWDSSSARINNLPTIDTLNEVNIQLTNNTGLITLDTTELSEKMIGRNLYGIALYSQEFIIETSIQNISTSLEYVPTKIPLPSVIRSTSVRLDWLPIISDQYVSTTLVRATNENFTDQVIVFETEDKSVITYFDKELTPENLYFYKIIVGLRNSDPIWFTTPEAGYKLVKNLDGLYDLVPSEGIGFDDPNVDYNFYTTPDKVIIRPYSMGQQIGGRNSDSQAVEVINFYNDVDYEITISAVESNGTQVLPDEDHEIGIFQDYEDTEWCTKIQFSELQDFSTFSYPLITTLNSSQRKIIYFKLRPSIYINVGQKTFKILVNAKPL